MSEDPTEEAKWKLEELLENTGMPDGTVEYIDSLDKWQQSGKSWTEKQEAAILRIWDQYIKDV